MGCGASTLSPEAQEQVATSKAIDLQLKEDRGRLSRETKLLLLGSASAGKSTFAKQMKILFMEGFSEDDKARFIDQVAFCVWRNLRVLVDAVHASLDVNLMKDCGPLISALTSAELIEIVRLPKYRDGMKRLWEEDSIRQAATQWSKLQIDRSVTFFMENLDRISADNYKPTVEDILLVKSKTLGLVETSFVYDCLRILLVDVGGQKNERRKWIHAFQDVTAVIFVSALTDFEELLEEDGTTNRMSDSITLFNQAVNNKWLRDKPVILFLNKTDLFEESIQRNPDAFHSLFPDFQGELTFIAGHECILKRFQKEFKFPQRGLYHFQTCNTDTSNVKAVFTAVSDIFLHETLSTFI